MVNNTLDFKSFTRLRMFCMKVLPTVYSDSLSYDEQVCKLTKRINDLSEVVGGLPDYIEEIVKEVIEGVGLENIVKQILSTLFFIDVKNPPNGMAPARGDGITSDTTALQALIVYASQNNATLFFPKGIYLVSGLILSENVSMVGLDRYNTTILLAGGSNKTLITGTIENGTISNLTFNANMPAQTSNISCASISAENCLFDNVIFKNGYDSFISDVNTTMTMNEILFDGIQHNGLTINGDNSHISNVQFKNVSQLNGNTLLAVSGNENDIKNIYSTDSVVNGIVITGADNVICGTIRNAKTLITGATGNTVDLVSNTGHEVFNINNTMHVSGNDSKYVGGSSSTTITNGYTETITGVKIENITGSKNETISENKTTKVTGTIDQSAQDIKLNPVNPLTYGVVNPYNAFFNTVTFKDKNNNPYDVLVKADGTGEIGSGPYVSVKDYGAKGDGITDDSAAFKAALDSGLDIYVPFSNKETYLIEQPVVIQNNPGQSMFSDVEWKSSEGGWGCIVFGDNGSFLVEQQYMHFSRLGFKSKNGTGATAVGTAITVSDAIELANSDCKIIGCAFSNFQYSIMHNGRGLRVQECLFVGGRPITQNYTFDGTGGGPTQQPTTGDRAITILSNRYHGGFQFFTNQSGQLRGALICNNLCDVGGQLVNNQATMNGCLIANNIVDLSATIPLMNNGNMTDCIIANNVLNGSDTSSNNAPVALMQSLTDSVFTGNLIQGNLFKNCTRSGFEMSSQVTDCIFDGNIFDNINTGGTARRGCFRFERGVSSSSFTNNRFKISSGYGIASASNSIVMSRCFVWGNQYTDNLMSNFAAGSYANIVQDLFTAPVASSSLIGENDVPVNDESDMQINEEVSNNG